MVLVSEFSVCLKKGAAIGRRMEMIPGIRWKNQLILQEGVENLIEVSHLVKRYGSTAAAPETETGAEAAKAETEEGSRSEAEE